MNKKVLHVDLGARSYPIECHDDFSPLADSIAPFVKGRKCAIVSNETVFGLYGETVAAAVETAQGTAVPLMVPDGEKYKTMQTVQQLLEDCVDAGLDRRSIMIALGGGVVGDITGFAASIYMRGIEFIHIPTTLLAQVDSSVGGKTGVNLTSGKNLAGVFAQPKCVFITPAVLSTLPIREMRAGYAEVIKYGVIRDRELFTRLEKETPAIMAAWETEPVRVPECVKDIILTCCAIKADVVAEDEREQGIRAILNYGHTFGHAIERLTTYGTYVHGEAVAIGMHAAAVCAHKLGMCDAQLIERQKTVITNAGLPVSFPHFPVDDSIEAFYHDKKTHGNTLRFILPRTIGDVTCVENPSMDILKETLRECR